MITFWNIPHVLSLSADPAPSLYEFAVESSSTCELPSSMVTGPLKAGQATAGIKAARSFADSANVRSQGIDSDCESARYRTWGGFESVKRGD